MFDIFLKNKWIRKAWNKLKLIRKGLMKLIKWCKKTPNSEISRVVAAAAISCGFAIYGGIFVVAVAKATISLLITLVSSGVLLMLAGWSIMKLIGLRKNQGSFA